MILVALGANLPSPKYGSPRETLEAALILLSEASITLVQHSGWYDTASIPYSDQPNYVNGVAQIATSLSPEAVLMALQGIEAQLGRTRKHRWEARIIDLDLIAYDDRVQRPVPTSDLELPHPRMHERGFVLFPLQELAPNWRHPLLGKSVAELIEGLEPRELEHVRRLP